MNTKIIKLDKSNSQHVAKLATCLLNEIIERCEINHFNVDAELIDRLCQQYMANSQYHVLAAQLDNDIIGFMAMCESHSLYAEGSFGIIQEFYVSPQYRSKKVGQRLIEAALEYAKEIHWKRLEHARHRCQNLKKPWPFIKPMVSRSQAAIK